MRRVLGKHRFHGKYQRKRRNGIPGSRASFSSPEGVSHPCQYHKASRDLLRAAGDRSSTKTLLLGPRSQKRGNPQNPCLKFHGPIGFNGAALTEARKPAASHANLVSWKASMGPRSQKRGNEAQIHGVKIDLAASMGPRSQKRGNCGRASQWMTEQSGFNGAALTEARKPTSTRRADQASGLASMGPRSQKRGNAVNEIVAFDAVLASMGPRSQKRGNRCSSLHDGHGTKLQWGRAHRSAETGRLVTVLSNSKSLQWGRAHRSAETRDPRQGHRHPPRRFNGAALTEARKLVQLVEWGYSESKLQWGRAHRSAETSPTPSGPLHSRRLQWGRAHRSAETKESIAALQRR